DVSIIIPVLNEANQVPQLLQYLETHITYSNTEIIVVDGGSTDTTAAKVAVFKKVRFEKSTKGRAHQMRKGACIAKGQILYFLHADTYPPPNFIAAIKSAITKDFKAGCFRMRFDSKHPLLQFFSWFTRFNHISCRGGDQSLFISKKLYESLGGFDISYEVYEDVEFIERIYKESRFKVLPFTLKTSARRYKKNGTVQLQYHFARIHWMRWRGKSALELQQYYQQHIL
ncbi:MAG: TIGR04283 family arsenosugar biosynthesis glycosyltransferase, partial [Flavobacteriaceae bacterium]|nr:TIGR04283 family arsenosugar biosynthesis glycosyltransferase [Flavobacteriaceae bacterium]